MSKAKNILFATVALLLSITMNSCNKQTIFDENKTLPASGWGKDSLAVFNVNITDTASSYRLLVNIRNGNEYAYQNFWLFISTLSPEKKMTTDTIECDLADEQGKWKGSGIGSLHEVNVLFLNNVRFKTSGNYRFAIQQGMRDDLLKGINDIGLEIQKIEN